MENDMVAKECKRYRRCEGQEPMPQDQWFGLLVKQSDPAKLQSSHLLYFLLSLMVALKRLLLTSIFFKMACSLCIATMWLVTHACALARF
jgi:hypothetical protein